MWDTLYILSHTYSCKFNNELLGVSSDAAVAKSLFACTTLYRTNNDFNLYMLLSGNNALKQMTSLIHGLLCTFMAVPWLRGLVAGLSPRSLGFAPGPIHVEFMVYKVALGQAFLRAVRFSLVNIITSSFSILIYYLRDEQYIR
jgi:hypothetical protein